MISSVIQKTNEIDFFMNYICHVNYIIQSKIEKVLRSYTSIGLLLSNHTLLIPFDPCLNNNDYFLYQVTIDVDLNSNNIHIPEKISIIDFKIFNDDNNSDDISNLNCWGIVVSELPLGQLMFFANKKQNSRTLSKKDICTKLNASYKEDNDLISYFPLKSFSISELLKANFSFIEALNENNIKTHILNKYDINFSDELILISNPTHEFTSPSIITCKVNKKEYVIGISSNIVIKSENEQQFKAIQKFSKEIILKANDYIESTENVLEGRNFSKSFNDFFFSEITNFELFKNSLRNNCKILFELIQQYNIRFKESMKKDSYQLKLSLILFQMKYKQEVIFKSLKQYNIGMDGTDILSESLKYLSLSELNMDNNSIYSLGLKTLLKPSFNLNKLNSVCNLLEKINLSSNKLSSKSMKYLRHVINEAENLKELILDNNYLNYLGVKYLLHSMEDKIHLTTFSLNNNVLGSKSGKYLYEILKNLSSIENIGLENNSLEDKIVVYISEALDKTYLKNLNLAKNYLTSICSKNINTIINNNNFLNSLNLANNSLFSEGEVDIFSNIMNKSSLSVINLSNNQISDEGLEMLFKNLNYCLKNSTINLTEINLSRNYFSVFGESAFEFFLKSPFLIKINLSYCLIGDEGANSIAQSFVHTNFEDINICGNKINEAGIEILLKGFFNSKLKKLSIENNEYDLRSIDISSKNGELKNSEGGKLFY